MPKRLIKVNLDFAKTDYRNKFDIKQTDDAILEIIPYENNLAYTIPTSSTCRLYVGVNDEAYKQEEDITIQDNKILIDLDKGILINSGFASAELNVTDDEGGVTSTTFLFSITDKIGEGVTIPGNIEGFVAKYERLIKEFKENVDSAVDSCNNRVDSKLTQLQKDYDDTKKSVTDKTDDAIKDMKSIVDKTIAAGTVDLETKKARVDMDGVEHADLKTRLESDLKKGKIIEEIIEGSYSTVSDTIHGIITDIEIVGNTYQDPNNLNIIKSTGIELEDGNYKYIAKVCGTNLFNGKLEIGSLVDATGNNNDNNQNCVRSVEYIRVNPNSIVKLSSDKGYNFNVYLYDKDKKYLGNPISMSTINVPNNCYYMRFRTSVGFVENDLSVKIWANYTNVYSYEPYQESEFEIILPYPLEGLTNGKDRLYYCEEEKAWCVDIGLSTILIDGSNSWNSVAPFTHNPDYVFIQTNAFDDLILDNTADCIASGFSPKNGFNVSTEAGYVGGYNVCTTYNNSKLRFSIPKTDLTSMNGAGVNEWFKANPTIVKATAKNIRKVVLPLDVQIALNSFDKQTNIWIESGEIDATIKGTVSKSIGASLDSVIKEQKINDSRLSNIENLQQGNLIELSTNKPSMLIEKSNEGYIRDLKLEGKTYNNIFDFSRVDSSAGWEYNRDTNVWTGTANGGWRNLYTNKDLYSPNTKYTIIVDVLQNSLNGNYAVVDGNINGIFTDTTAIIYPGAIGRFVYKPITRPDITTTTQGFRSFITNLATTGTIQLKITILEGWIEEDELPQNFKGLCSVGQDNELTVETYNDGNLFNGVVKNQTVNTLGQIRPDENGRTTDFIEVPSDIDVTISATQHNANRYGVVQYDKDKNFISFLQDPSIYTGGYTIKTSPITKYIILYYNNGDNANVSKLIPATIRVNVSNRVGSYLEPESNKSVILYKDKDEVYKKPILRDIGAERDTIEEGENDKTYYNRITNEVCYKGTQDEKWFLVSSKVDTIGFGINISPKGSTNLGRIISNIFKVMGDDEKEQIRLGNDGNSVFIFILKSRLETQDIEGFKKWLQSNNLTAIYQLLQKEIYECTTINLRAYQGSTLYRVSSGAIHPKSNMKSTQYIGDTVKEAIDKVDRLEDTVAELTNDIVAEYTSDNGSILIEGSKDGVIDNLKLTGKTLINYSGISKGSHTINRSSQYIEMINLNQLVDNKVKLSFYCTENTSSASVGMMSVTAYSDGTASKYEALPNDKGVGLVEKNYSITSNISSIKIYLHGNNQTSDFAKIQDVMLVKVSELDYINSYFEGMKSVGDGADKIEVLSRKEDGNLINDDFKNGEIYNVFIPKGTYTVSCKASLATIRYYRKGGSQIDHWSLSGENGIIHRTFTSNEDIYSLLLDSIDAVDVQWLKGTIIKPYQLPKQHKKQNLYYDPADQTWKKPILREGDTIEQHSDGKTYFHKRSGIKTFKGGNDESWSEYVPITDENMQSAYITVSEFASNTKARIICDKLQASTQSTTNEYIIMLNNMAIGFLKSSLETPDLAGLKKRLATSPITVIAPLAQEEVYECTPLTLDSYEGETLIQFIGGAVNPTMEVRTLSGLPKLYQNLKTRINHVEDKYTQINNMFKQVLSGDMQELAYMLYPEDFYYNEYSDDTGIPFLYKESIKR